LIWVTVQTSLGTTALAIPILWQQVEDDRPVFRLPFNQAFNQLGTPGGGEDFSERVSKFLNRIVLNYVQHIFQGGGRKIFQRRLRPPLCLRLVTDLHFISVFTEDLTCFNVENVRVLTHVLYVFTNVQRIFSAKFFSLGNLFLLTNFQLFTAPNTVTIVAHIFIKRCYAWSTVVTIPYCRDGQLI